MCLKRVLGESRFFCRRPRRSSDENLHQGSRVTLREACSKAASVYCVTSRELAVWFELVIPVRKVDELEADR